MVTSSLHPARHSSVRRRGINPVQRLASALILGYLRHAPLERGKWRLMRFFGPSLLVELEPGLFMRPLGLSAVEVGIIRRGMFEPETVSAFAALLAPGMTVMDIGANVGQFTLVAAGRVGPNGCVHAFEPTPELAAHILSNLELNGLENVAVNEIAVSEVAGRAMLHFSEPGDPGENSIVNFVPGVRAIEVPTVTLDGYVASRGIGRVDVIKVDIEGAEMSALRGARVLLSGDDSPVLVLECHPKTLAFTGQSPDDMLTLLSSYGYSLYPIAVYSQHTPDPYLNGIAAKSTHFDKFPVLRRWQQRPISSWAPALLKTFKYLPVE
jgi:FkbM family methyltransferase